MNAVVGMLISGYISSYFSPSGNCSGSPLSIAVTVCQLMFIMSSSTGGRNGGTACVCGMPVTSLTNGPSLLPGESG